MTAPFLLFKEVNMREISNALSDAIFTVCKRIISEAKFDKTYKCRVVTVLPDNKYVVMKDNVKHAVVGKNKYEVNEVVYVLLPENSWLNALIL